MIRKKSFVSSYDGTELEIDALIPDAPDNYLVIWPCSMFSYGIYKMPVEKFALNGTGVLQFNPRAHGNSGGRFSYEKSFNDLVEICKDLFKPGVPVNCLGHSGGACALLKIGGSINAGRFWLVSPVLDSRESLFFMYESGTIEEFINIILSISGDPDKVKRIIETTEWLKNEIWDKNGLKDLLDSYSKEIPIGSLLEAIFIPGHNSFKELGLYARSIEIIYPVKDTWYPERTVMGLAREHGVKIIRDLGGKDHYFTGAWKNVWNYIENRLVSLYSA